MKGIIWKECRENLPWMVFAMLAFGVASVYFQNTTGPSPIRPNGMLFAFALWTPCGAPVIALMLGFATIFKEQRRDQLAFLLHRPTTRTAIWAGKAVAGIGMYVVVAFVPFWIGVWWTSVPGHVPAPFEIGMSEAGTAEILAGVVFFFAGMLIAGRPARWYASKVLPIIIAVTLTAAALVITSKFIYAILGILLMSVILGFASWSSFLVDGSYDRQSRLGKIILGAIMYGGCCILLMVIVQPVRTTPWARDQQAWCFDAAGRPVILHEIFATTANSYSEKYTDLSGKEIANGAVYQYLGQSTFTAITASNYWNVGGYVIALPGMQRPGSGQSSEGDAWYFDAVEGRIVGFDLTTRNQVGAIGPSALTSANPSPVASDAFPRNSYMYVDYRNNANDLLVAHDKVYRLLGHQLTNASVIQTSNGTPITSLSTMLRVTGSNRKQIFLITTPTRLEMYNEDNQLIASVPLSPVKLNQQIAGILDNGNVAVMGSGLSPVLTVYTPTGQVVSRRRLPRLGSPNIPQPLSEMAGLALPPISLLETVLNHFQPEHSVTPFGWLWANSGGQSQILAPVIEVMIVSTLAAIYLTWLVGMRCGFRFAEWWQWLVAVAALGLCGLLMLLCLRGFPSRVTCTACGRTRVVNRVNCEHCGAGWPKASQSGTEIFDDPQGDIAMAALRSEAVA